MGSEGDTTARYLHVNGKLGFHAPYIMPPEKKYSSQEVHSMVVQTNAIIADFIAFGSDPSAYSTRPFFPVSLIAELLAAGPDELAMVDTIEDVTRWDITLYGMPSHVSLGDNDLTQACINFMAWELDRPSRKLDPQWALSVVKEAGISYGKSAEWSVISMGDMDYRGCRIKTPEPSIAGLLICSRDEANGVLRGDCEEGWSAYVPWYYALDPTYLFERLDDV